MIFNPQNLSPGQKFVDYSTVNIDACYFDVDNTLVPNDSAQLPSEEFRRLALRVGAEIPVNIATARSLQRVGHVLKSIGSQGVSILSNGAVLYDGKKEEIVDDLQIDLDVTNDICEQIRMLGLKHQVQDDGLDYRWQNDMQYSSPISPLYPEGERQKSADYQYHPYKPRLIDVKVYTEAEMESVYNLVNALDAKTITISVGHKGLDDKGKRYKELFIMHRYANKHHALLRAFDIQSLKKENILAVGDGPNDRVLLKLAGVGIAMGNAVSESLAQANFVAPTQEQDGGVQVLQGFFEHDNNQGK
jgi:HAD superfamily hydrolase (TIGR01484 family)